MESEPVLTPFQEDDAVLYRSEAFEKYCEKGGLLSEACEALSTSYEGIEDMIEMVMSWVDIYGDGVKAFEDATETVLKENEQTITQRLEESLPASDKAQPVMAQIASSGRWKPAIMEIADRHRSSALYNMLTRESRLIEAGVQPTNMLSPEIFLNALCDQLTTLFTNGATISDSDLIGLYNRLTSICTYDECTMVCGLRLFSEMSRYAEQPSVRAMFRRISQETRKAAITVMSTSKIVPPLIARQYVVRMAVNVDCAAAGVAMPKTVMDALLALMSSVSGKRPYDKEIKIILDAYKDLLGPLDIGFYGEPKENNRNGDTASEMDVDNPSNAMERTMLILSLCHIEVFEDLLFALFTNAHRVQQEARKKSERNQTRRRCISLLLAYAAVFLEKDSQETIKLFLAEAPATAVADLRDAVKTKYGKIELLAEACEALYPGCARFLMKGTRMTLILEAICDPVLARAVLIWAREGIKGGDNAQQLIVTAPKHLAVMEQIAKDHPVLRGRVLEAIREALKRDFQAMQDTLQVDLRDLFMTSLVGMVSIQMAPELIHEFLEHYADDSMVDDSLRRRFVGGLLKSIEPPYSRPFAALVLRLLQHHRVANVVETDPTISNEAMQFRRVAYEMGVS